jgi:hypothetical protein
MDDQHGAVSTLVRLFRDAEALMKEPGLAGELARRGVNASIAILAVQGLTAYVEGRRSTAHDDLATAAEEIKARMAILDLA